MGAASSPDKPKRVVVVVEAEAEAAAVGAEKWPYMENLGYGIWRNESIGLGFSISGF